MGSKMTITNNFFILKIQVLTHQELKITKSYVNDQPHLRPIVNYHKLTIYGNLRLAFKGVNIYVGIWILKILFLTLPDFLDPEEQFRS